MRTEMYPQTYLSLFPPFPRDERVFVAMSFDNRFSARWTDVLVPAIRSMTSPTGTRLEPHRVDLRQASDSIITEIVDGIARCRFFIADVTTMGLLDGREVRNGNVMYEVGIAHAARLPEEVLLLRSDNDDIPFDVRGIRIVSYSPDSDPTGSIATVVNAVAQSQRELDQRRSLAVRDLAHALDVHGWLLLLEAAAGREVFHPETRNMGDVLGGAPRREALSKLLSAGLLSVRIRRLTQATAARPVGELFPYVVTEFGRAVARYGRTVMGLQN